MKPCSGLMSIKSGSSFLEEHLMISTQKRKTRLGRFTKQSVNFACQLERFVSRGTNLLVIVDSKFSSFEVVKIGKLTHPSRGFSALQFIPGTKDHLIIALKSEEKDGKPVNSYVSVFDIKGNILLPDSSLNDPYKFEGIAFV